MFDQCDGHVAQGWRQLGSNPSASYLLVSVVASLENAGVEGKRDDGGDVRGVDSTLCRMPSAMSANRGVVKGIAGGFGVDGEGARRLLSLPFLDEGVDCVNQAVLRDRIEEADQVVVCGAQGDVCWSLGEVGVKVTPELWDRELSRVLWEEVL